MSVNRLVGPIGLVHRFVHKTSRDRLRRGEGQHGHEHVLLVGRGYGAHWRPRGSHETGVVVLITRRWQARYSAVNRARSVPDRRVISGESRSFTGTPQAPPGKTPSSDHGRQACSRPAPGTAELLSRHHPTDRGPPRLAAVGQLNGSAATAKVKDARRPPQAKRARPVPVASQHGDIDHRVIRWRPGRLGLSAP